MKKLLSVLVVALLLPLAVSANTKFQQGKHYEVIADKATEKGEVKEYFSFFCGGCFAFEPVAQQLAKDLPDNIEFKKVHVDFLRNATPEIQNVLARAYLVAKQQGKGDQVASAIFNQIHRNRATFRSADDIRSLVLINDIDGQVYDNAIKSFAITGAANQMKKEQDELSERKVLTGVPTLIVNGKYKILQGNLNSRNLQQELKELVEYLAAKDAK